MYVVEVVVLRTVGGRIVGFKVPSSYAGSEVEDVVGACDELELRRGTGINGLYGKCCSRSSSRGDLRRRYEGCSGRCRRYRQGGARNSEARTRFN